MSKLKRLTFLSPPVFFVTICAVGEMEFQLLSWIQGAFRLPHDATKSPNQETLFRYHPYSVEFRSSADRAEVLGRLTPTPVSQMR